MTRITNSKRNKPKRFRCHDSRNRCACEEQYTAFSAERKSGSSDAETTTTSEFCILCNVSVVPQHKQRIRSMDQDRFLFHVPSCLFLAVACLSGLLYFTLVRVARIRVPSSSLRINTTCVSQCHTARNTPVEASPRLQVI